MYANLLYTPELVMKLNTATLYGRNVAEELINTNYRSIRETLQRHSKTYTIVGHVNVNFHDANNNRLISIMAACPQPSAVITLLCNPLVIESVCIFLQKCYT